MALFGKKKEPAAVSVPDTDIQRLKIVYDHQHYQAIFELLQELIADGKLAQIQQTVYLNCRIEDEDGQLKVYAAKSGRGNTYRYVGVIPTDYKDAVLKAEIEKVRTRKYFWSLSLYYHYINVCSFELSLKESKFSK